MIAWSTFWQFVIQAIILFVVFTAMWATVKELKEVYKKKKDHNDSPPSDG